MKTEISLEETPIRTRNQSFIDLVNQTLNDSRQENVNLRKDNSSMKQLNVTRNKIIVEDFNDDDGGTDGRSASDWLNNGIFLISLEDQGGMMSDKEKISTLMKSLKGSLKEAMFTQLRKLEESKLTFQEFQRLFIAQTSRSTKELESRLNRITRENSNSLFDMHKRITNIVEAQLQNAGIEKKSNNTEEVVAAIVDNHVRKKLHKTSELFQTSTKTGHKLIQLAKDLDELTAARSVNTMKKESLQNENSKRSQEQMTIQQYKEWKNEKTDEGRLKNFDNSYEQKAKCFACGKLGHYIRNCKKRTTYTTGRFPRDQGQAMQQQRYAQRLPQANWQQTGNWQRGGRQDFNQIDNAGYQGYQYNPRWGNQQGYYQQGQGRGNHGSYSNGSNKTSRGWSRSARY